MKTKLLIAAAALTSLVAGCYAPMARVTPAEGTGVRVSMAEGACFEPRAATTETPEESGHLYAKLEIENHSERALRFDSKSVRFIDHAASRNPWLLQRQYTVAPRSHREVELRVSSHGIRCDREMTVAFGDSLSVDGQPVDVSPLRFVPTHDQRVTLAER
jgi:hypothetical protein